MSLSTGNKPGCVPAVTLGVTEALAMLALQGSLRSNVHLHRDAQTAELSEGAHPFHVGSPRHRHKVRGEGASFSCLISTAEAELKHSLDTDAQTLQLLPDGVLRHVSAKVPNQETHAAVLR